MQILPAQHLLRPTAASLQELRNQCLTSKHIKTYQNISKHIKTQHLQSAASTNSPRSARIEQHHFACRVNGVRNQTDRICAFDCFCSCLFFFWSQKNCGRIRFILQALSKSCPPCLAFQTESNRSRALLLIVLLASRFWDFKAATSYCGGLQTHTNPTSTHNSAAKEPVFKRQTQRNCTAFSRCAMTLLKRRGFWYVLHMSVTCLSHVCHMSGRCQVTTCTMCFRWMSAWRVHVSLSKPTCRDELACCACKCITCKSSKENPQGPQQGININRCASAEMGFPSRHKLALLVVFFIWMRQVIWRYEARACDALSGNMFDPSSAVSEQVSGWTFLSFPRKD